ncbi:MAG: hypothetical protein K8R53_08760 [Bacteroidales bacterium]|nr:hypothetical protein [Bacteroidales bacterium]
MKKRDAIFWVIAFVLIICSIPVPALSKWVSFNGAKYHETPELKLDVSNSEQILLDFTFPGMNVAQIKKNGISYQNLSIKDRGNISKVGAPQVPVMGKYIAIPFGARAEVEIIDSKSKLLKGYTIYPAQEPIPEVYGALPQKFKIDESIYSTDSFYPSSIVQLDDPVVIRGLKVSILRISPVQYNPVKHSLRVYSKLKVKIVFQNSQGYFIEKRLKSPAFDNLFKALVLNPVKEPEIDGAEENNNFLLTITHPDFIEAAGKLTQWKREKGINSEIRTTIQTGTSASQIRAYIQNAYDTWDIPPTYILFLGDSEFVPCNYVTTHPYTGIAQGDVGTDLYYATVDGSDYFPDISTGRISVDTLDQAMKRVDDIIQYEKDPVADPSFYENASIAAYFQHDYNGYAERRFAQTSEDLAIFLSDSDYLGKYFVDRIYYAYSSVYPRYWSNSYFSGGPAGDAGDAIPEYLRKDIFPYFPWDGDSTDVSYSVNQGRFLLTHRDHGSRSGWGEPYFTTSHVNSLTNSNKLPVVLSINCQTGWFDNETDNISSTSYSEINFSEAWERNPNGGAIGVIAATRVSYSGFNDRLCWGWIDAIWPDFIPGYTLSGTPFDSPEFEMGQVLNYGKYYLAATYGATIYRQIEFEMFHWFGDPTMKIWTDVPESVDVTHDDKIPEGSTSLDITMGESPVPVLICISKNSEILAKAMCDSYQTCNFSWNTPLVSEDEIKVTVTGQNIRPYQGIVQCQEIVDECECDLTGDSQCDMADWLKFGEDWGRSDCGTPPGSGSLPNDCECDLNQDGKCDMADWLKFGEDWGRTDCP